MAGRLLGEKNYRGLYVLVKKVLVYGLIVSLVLIAIGLTFYNSIGNIFSNDISVLSTFHSIFFILLLSLPINTIAFVFDGLFKGLGEMKYLRNTLLWATLLGFIPTLFICKYVNLQLNGIWIALTVWMLLRGGALLIEFRRKFMPLILAY